MKTNRYLAPLGVLVFLLLSLVPSEGQQQLSYVSAPAQLALSYTFSASSVPGSAIPVNGLRYWQILFVPSGSVSTCALSFDSSTGSGFSTGGIIPSATVGSCASAGGYNNTSPTAPTLLGQLTPTITGTGTVTVVLLGYVNNPGAAGSSAASITSPVDGSGYVEVNCKTGCTGGNANGQATMANSSPVVIASNQSAVAVTAAQSTAANLNATVVQATGSNLHTAVDSLPALPAGSNAIGSVTVTSTVATPAGTNAIGSVNPTLSSGAVIAGQQSVTASAAALPSTALTRPACLLAPVTNGTTVYIGPSGVTTSTGFPLAAGGSLCGLPVSNLNQLYVIASTTGSSVAWSAQ